MKKSLIFKSVSIFSFAFVSSALFAQEGSTPAQNSTAVETEKAAPKQQSLEEISRALSNPVANLINVPIQFNWDYGAGTFDHGNDYQMKIQPVIPIPISEDWRILSRTIFIVESKQDMGFSSETGLGDITQTFFLSPAKHKDTKLVWGVGPAFLIPTATENHLGQKKFGIGPSAVLAYQLEDFTLGVLANHIWDVAGYSDRPYVSQTFVQPFFAWHLPHASTLTLNSEYVYDWHAGQETFPINLTIGRVFKIGKLPVNIAFGGRYYIDRPDDGPKWGLRLQITLVFPE